MGHLDAKSTQTFLQNVNDLLSELEKFTYPEKFIRKILRLAKSKQGSREWLMTPRRKTHPTAGSLKIARFIPRTLSHSLSTSKIKLGIGQVHGLFFATEDESSFPGTGRVLL